jgi:hypothetical protein
MAQFLIIAFFEKINQTKTICIPITTLDIIAIDQSGKIGSPVFIAEKYVPKTQPSCILIVVDKK